MIKIGQYYYPVNLDSREYLYSHDYGSGLKLMEHSYIDNPFVTTVLKLLKKGQPWYKARIVWAGDYGEMKFSDFAKTPNEHLALKIDPDEENIHSSVSKKNKINPDIPRQIKNVILVNHTTKEYVLYSKIKPDKYDFKINPLPLLTADGNGQGGGDYRGSNMHLVGQWAGHVISVETKIPKDFTELEPNFKEGQE